MTSSKNGQLSLWSSSYKISGLWRLRKSCPRSDDSTFFGNWEFQPQHDPGNLLDPFWGLQARVTTTRKDNIKKWANSLPYKETDAKFDRKVWTKNQKEISKRKKKKTDERISATWVSFLLVPRRERGLDSRDTLIAVLHRWSCYRGDISAAHLL